ncbi:cell division inhibitor [Klebsiella pneumoniae]|uniref:Cell division inhibitor n=1 Tax=Klebsiella pneumoniae TaxID=573 RepID=A0A377V6U9_KLEPN|nr:cell division inhibitor [Klebsiella pneumoniae]
MLISGSAIGYYGDLGEVVVTEEEPPHNEFTHKLCARWEQIACEAQSERTRVCLLRTGVVLAPRGGILGKMTPAFKLGLGGPIGNADSTWPGSISTIWLTAFCGCWITICAVRSIWFLPTRCITSSSPMRWVMRSIDRRFSAFPPPLSACWMGESAVLVLGGQRALPKRLEAAGFAFRWYDLDEALKDVLS